MQIRTAIVAAFTAGMALVPMSAKAICQQTIYAERSFSDGMSGQIIGHVNTTDDHTFLASTTSPVISSLIFAAVASRNTVFLIGNAATCPTTGTVRDMGTIIQIFQQP